MKSTLALLAAAALIGTAGAAEKYPTSIPRNGMTSAVTTALNLRLNDFGNPLWVAQINSATSQVRMSPSALSYQQDLVSRPLSPDEKAYRLLGEINTDIDLPVGWTNLQNVSPLAPEVAFSAQFNVSRLKWARDVKTGTCKVQRPNLTNYDLPIAEEAEYEIYRNGVLVTRVPGDIQTGSAGTVNSFPISFGWVNFRVISIPYSVTPSFGATYYDMVWYDLDPYQGLTGQPVRYEIKSRRKGCIGVVLGGGENMIAGFGPVSSQASVVLWLDGDGDANPDFIPASYLAMKRAEITGGLVPGMGKLELSFPPISGFLPVTLRNVGLGDITGLNVRCEGSSANVLSQPPSVLGQNQSVTVSVWRFTGSLCKPIITGTNANNLPLRTDRF